MRLNQTPRPVLIVIFFFFAWVTLTYGQDSSVTQRAERPVFTPGDYWVFKEWRDDIQAAKESKTVFIKETDGAFMFDQGKGEIIHTDLNLTPTKKTRGKTGEVIWEKGLSEYPGPALDFPLEIGKRWELPYEENTSKLGSTARKMFDSMLAKYSVTAYEQVSVPAGTFPAFRIECERYTMGGKATGNDTYWYSPKVKKVVKYSRRNKNFELLEFLVQ